MTDYERTPSRRQRVPRRSSSSFGKKSSSLSPRPTRSIPSRRPPASSRPVQWSATKPLLKKGFGRKIALKSRAIIPAKQKIPFLKTASFPLRRSGVNPRVRRPTIFAPKPVNNRTLQRPGTQFPPRPWRGRRGSWLPYSPWVRAWDEDEILTDDLDSINSSFYGSPDRTEILWGINPASRKALYRSGLMDPAWVKRLRQGPEAIVRFVRRFASISGFEYVVKGFFGNQLQKRVSVIGMRLAHRIAERLPDCRDRIIFTQEIGFAPGGNTFLTFQMKLDGRHFIILPWTGLDRNTVSRQFASDRILFGDSDAIRWVLSARSLGMQKEHVINLIISILSVDSDGEYGESDGRLAKMLIVLP